MGFARVERAAHAKLTKYLADKIAFMCRNLKILTENGDPSQGCQRKANLFDVVFMYKLAGIDLGKLEDYVSTVKPFPPDPDEEVLKSDDHNGSYSQSNSNGRVIEATSRKHTECAGTTKTMPSSIPHFDDLDDLQLGFNYYKPVVPKAPPNLIDPLPQKPADQRNRKSSSKLTDRSLTFNTDSDAISTKKSHSLPTVFDRAGSSKPSFLISPIKPINARPERPKQRGRIPAYRREFERRHEERLRFEQQMELKRIMEAKQKLIDRQPKMSKRQRLSVVPVSSHDSKEEEAARGWEADEVSRIQPSDTNLHGDNYPDRNVFVDLKHDKSLVLKIRKHRTFSSEPVFKKRPKIRVVPPKPPVIVVRDREPIPKLSINFKRISEDSIIVKRMTQNNYEQVDYNQWKTIEKWSHYNALSKVVPRKRVPLRIRLRRMKDQYEVVECK
ncbi:unnamed protein product [Caenorhabditis bovis]|uniref:Uncharacterized protein n=1 Tax=Caenorhabditis bovis TaxID=2654633 RepID=A0A8S1ES35_9PELO|nr:unnamed protein product [Caenorhabditis bovis]